MNLPGFEPVPEGLRARPDLRAAFFDLDGTLIDSEVIYVEAVRLALFRRGAFLSDSDAVALVYGRGWKDIFADVLDRFPASYHSSGEMEEIIGEEFEALRQERDIRIPGSIRLLKSLSRLVPVAVVSGSTRKAVEMGVQYCGIADDLQFFLAAEDYSPGKPDPIGYLTAAARLGVLPDTCIVFEDSTAGVKAAKLAGMYCVALRRDGTPHQEVSLADQVYSDLADFDVEGFLGGIEA